MNNDTNNTIETFDAKNAVYVAAREAIKGLKTMKPLFTGLYRLIHNHRDYTGNICYCERVESPDPFSVYGVTVNYMLCTWIEEWQGKCHSRHRAIKATEFPACFQLMSIYF
jgi:hypothetical protein